MDGAAELIDAARKGARNAYVTYSHFPVGAAVRTSDGEIVLGCNVENASYGLTVCAERVALFAAVAKGLIPVELAVTCPEGDSSRRETVMPCGACRQVMAEILALDARVHVDGVGTFTIDELLPSAFRLD